METENNIKTYFDNPERKCYSDILLEQELFRSDELFKQLLESFPEMVYILNGNRQIIAWNSKSFLIHNNLDILGKRFGEAIDCVHSKIMDAGCGTSKFCAECGMAKSVKNTIDNSKKSVEECRITGNSYGVEISYDFLVETTPINYKSKDYYVCALKDIADEKRRLALERIFFHDVLNTSGAINGLAYMVKEIEDKKEIEELHDAMIDSSNQLIHEILAQRELRNAEENTLVVNKELLTVNHILKSAYNLYFKNQLAKDRIFEVEWSDPELKIETDKFLLVRSIGNLLKNALEVSVKGDHVKIYVSENEGFICFNIYNDKVIPDNIQLQIFKRSFTTKGSPGRGIGTYSVKLIIEQFMQGKVSFISNDKVKTIFTIQIPR